MKRKQNIEWSTHSWNWSSGCNGPKGDGVHCPGCYAKPMAYRLKGRYGYPEEDPFAVTLHPDKLYRDMGHPHHPGLVDRSRIYFNVSMGDWLDFEVDHTDRVEACRIMCKNPQHIFVTLTKMYHSLWKIPASFKEGVIPENVWVGISVCNRSQLWGLNKLLEIDCVVRMLCIEPMLEDLSFIELDGLDWLIIGARTPHGGLPYFRPQMRWVKRLVEKARERKISVFLKPNLNYVPEWYPEAIEEMPFNRMSSESVWSGMK